MTKATIERGWRRRVYAIGIVAAMLVSGCGGGGGSTSSENTPPPTQQPAPPGSQPAPPNPSNASLFPSGSLDAADQQSARGWACNAGDPTTKLSVELWAIDASTGGWVYVTTMAADKQQAD